MRWFALATGSILAFHFSSLLSGSGTQRDNMFHFSRKNLEGVEMLVSRRQWRSIEWMVHLTNGTLQGKVHFKRLPSWLLLKTRFHGTASFQEREANNIPTQLWHLWTQGPAWQNNPKGAIKAHISGNKQLSNWISKACSTRGRPCLLLKT